MKRISTYTRAAGISALLAFTAFPVAAEAGQANRARSAIAEAKGKIEAGDKVGASAGAPVLQTQARSALGEAETFFAAGKKTEAIAAAKRAGELADMAIVDADKAKTEAANRTRMDAEAATANAQQSAAASNARASSAEQAAASASAQADALRNAPVVAPAPAIEATVETTTVETPPAPVVQKKKRVRHTQRSVERKAVPSVTQKTTTTLSTEPR